MVNQMSWDSFQKHVPEPKQNPEMASTEKQKPQKESQDFSWGSFQNTSTYQGEPDPTAEESTLGYLARLTTSNIARGTERHLGRYGDIEKTAKSALSKLPGATGILGEAIKSMIGQKRWDTLIGTDKQLLPTSEDVKKMTMAATGEYTKPKTKNEARAQEFSADVGSVASSRGTSVANHLVNKLGIPVAANAAKETVKELGFGEDAGTYTKLAAQTALTLLNNVNAPAYAAQMMNEGRNGFGPNVVANVPRYENSLNRVARNMYQGDPRSALAQQQIAGIRNDIQNGQTSMRDLMNRYDALNAAKRDRGLFQLGRTDRRAAIRNINEVRDAVRAEIQHLGTVNPQALDSWRGGVQAFSVIHGSNAITNLANEWLTGPLSKSAVGALFGTGTFGALKSSAALTGGASLAASGLYKGGQVAYRVWRDPNLSNYYWQAMRAAANRDGPAFLANYNKLNKFYEKKYGQESQR